MAVRVYIDFDGTITTRDVGNALFITFGGEVCDELVRSYRAGHLSARQCFLGEAAAVGALDQKLFENFVAEQPIDPSFPEFVDYCTTRRFEAVVLSDGLDLYIRPILERHGLQGLQWFANHATTEGNGGVLRLEFPHGNAECDRCACCKRNIMLTGSSENDVIVYVGEGFSDQCPAGYADVVFAKDALQTYCQKHNISYLPYRTFGDVRRKMDLLAGRGHLRKRHRAEVRRREAFIGEA
jgi:2,3-diketo-5-methylthio-1-phosphopentane phosphatase